ncbi:hypothetical protein LINGRAHAP2_LOCUS20460, partial [Linum grandiflorum]
LNTGPPAKKVVEVYWPSPPPEWVALNSDESVIPETRQPVAGGGGGGGGGDYARSPGEN